MKSKGTQALSERGATGAMAETRDTGDQTESEPKQEHIFEILSNERRRYVLSVLKQHANRTVELGNLVTHVAALENGVSTDKLDSDDRKTVYVGLRQTHLPKMDDYGFVNYDRNRGTVELTETARRAQMYLEYVPENDIPWCHHYLGLSVILGGVAGLKWMGAFPFGGLGGMSLATLSIVVLGLSGVVHTAHTYRTRLGFGNEPEQER